jgi:hypothetical protein
VRHVRTLGVCLAAIFALSALIATTASAGLPEWGGCEYSARGKYTDNACTHKAEHKGEGNYEWFTGAEFGRVARFAEEEPPAQLKKYVFSFTPGPATFETRSGRRMYCADGNGGGEAGNQFELENANKETKETTSGVHNVLLSFGECESEGEECYSNAHYALGEVTNLVAWENENGEDPQGKLFFIDKAKGEVGIELSTRQKTSKTEPVYLLKADCEGAVGTFWFGGEKGGKNTLLIPIGPVDTMTTAFTATLTQGAPGEQLPHVNEKGKELYMQAFLEHRWEPFAISTTLEIHKKFEAGLPIEIKAAA